MPPFDSLDPTMTNSLSATPDDVPAAEEMMAPSIYDDATLITLFERLKKEAFEFRWVWEREWLRDVFYVMNRQWIYYHPTRREWVDKRLQKNVPRPVTNKMAEIVQSLRATFGSINLGVVARPIGNNPDAVAASEVTDKIAPLLHDEHKMTNVLREGDFWFITTGSVCLQISWDTDVRDNKAFVPHEACASCGQTYSPKEIMDAGEVCPTCMTNEFVPAMDETQKPIGEWVSFGAGKTTPLSPFEYALPPNITKFDEAPYIIRMRWRDKHYFEANFPDMVPNLVFEKSPSDRSLQIFKSLAVSNDLGIDSAMNTLTAGGQNTVEGLTEYEIWMKPTSQYPEGLVFRVVGDKSPQILHQEEEQGLPGPIPFKDRDGMPLFPFAFAVFEHVGGRIYGRSALSPLIQKQDQLNQLDSLTQMIVQRMANPVWIIPEGAGIDHFTGDPGLVMKWNPLSAGGTTAKPERIAGENIPATLFQLRQQYLKDIEDLSGAYDILRGQTPTRVEAFSSLQLLVERSQARFTSAFASRGEMYRKWFAIALELERQFGPRERTLAVLGPNKGYTFQKFQNAQLQGNVTIHIEDGTDVPKTALGERAAIEHAAQLGMIDPADPDQRYTILTKLGLSDLVPGLDTHVQTALRVQDEFERWVEGGGMGINPLVVKPWHNPMIHYNERIKWLNTDRMKEMLDTVPQLEPLITLHLQELQMLAAPPPAAVGPDGKPVQQGPPGQSGPPTGPDKGVGAGKAMERANNLAGSPTINQNNEGGA